MAKKKDTKNLCATEVMARAIEEGKIDIAKEEEPEFKRIDWVEAHNQLLDRIELIEQRIDRIVDAHDKCRKLKGL
jgi:gamma-glutamyl phosphate reductase